MRLNVRNLSIVPTLFATIIAAPLTLGQSEGFLEEVLVTAEKRETTLQDTAIAVSAFSDIWGRDIWGQRYLGSE